MTIKHIVITGGDHIGLSSLGILTESYKKKQWQFENIESVWGTSSGSMIAVMLCLKMDFETINKYTLERPWSFLSITTEKLINLIGKKGLFGMEEYCEFYRPLFLSCDLNLNVTMKELYDYSKIELNMLATELNDFKTITINHKTFPDLKVVEGIMMSSAIPLLIKPVKYNEKYYFDGAIFVNFPIVICHEEKKCEYEEILGIRRLKEFTIDHSNTNSINNLIDYIFIFIVKILVYCHKSPDTSMFPNIYIIDLKEFSLDDLKKLIEPYFRKYLFNYGVNIVTPNEDNNDLSNNDLSNNDLFVNELSTDISDNNILSDNIIIDDNINIEKNGDTNDCQNTYKKMLENVQNDLII